MSSTQRPTNITSVISNRGVLRARPLRRRHNQLRIQRRIVCPRNFQHTNVPTSNEDTLERVKNLPRQVTDDELVNQFFNGYQLP